MECTSPKLAINAEGFSGRFDSPSRVKPESGARALVATVSKPASAIPTGKEADRESIELTGSVREQNVSNTRLDSERIVSAEA